MSNPFFRHSTYCPKTYIESNLWSRFHFCPPKIHKLIEPPSSVCVQCSRTHTHTHLLLQAKSSSNINCLSSKVCLINLVREAIKKTSLLHAHNTTYFLHHQTVSNLQLSSSNKQMRWRLQGNIIGKDTAVCMSTLITCRCWTPPRTVILTTGFSSVIYIFLVNFTMQKFAMSKQGA